MSLSPLKGLAPEWFTPSSQQDDEDSPARFKLKPLNGVQLDQALEGATYNDKGDLVDLSARGKVAALRFGLVGWENYDDKFKVAKFINIPWQERQEIAFEIINISVVQEDDEKNS